LEKLNLPSRVVRFHCGVLWMVKSRVSALLGCAHCGLWSGWVSKWFDPEKGQESPRTINTICSCCHGRLRHKRSLRDPERQYTHVYTSGRGAHNRSTSVFKYRPWNDPSTCKSEASRINTQILHNRARKHATSFVPASEFFQEPKSGHLWSEWSKYIESQNKK